MRKVLSERVFASGQPNFRKRGNRCVVEGLLAIRPRKESIARSAVRLYGQGNIFQRGESRQHRRDLKRSRQAKLGTPVCRQVGDIGAVEMNGAGRGGDKPGNLVDTRRLGGDVRSDDGVLLVWPD